ncbi:hypothetical protein ACLOAV_004619 [Pseudogymnoascus australis]
MVSVYAQRSSTLPPPLVVALPGPSHHSTVQDDVASDQERLSPLSPLQEEWLDRQSLFVSDDENEGSNTAEDEARYRSANERENTVLRRRRAYVSKGVYTSGVHGRDYTPSVNES